MKKGHYCLLVILLSLSIVSHCQQATPTAATPAQTPSAAEAVPAANGNGATNGQGSANGNGNGNGNGKAAEATVVTAPAPVPIRVEVVENGNGKATNGQSTQTQTKATTQTVTTTTTTTTEAAAPAPVPVPVPVPVAVEAPAAPAAAPTPVPVAVAVQTTAPASAASVPLTITTTPAAAPAVPAPVVIAPAPVVVAPAPVAPAPAAQTETIGSLSPQCPKITAAVLCEVTYKPVCGFLVNGTSTTFTNKCTACNFKDVVGFTEGFCQSSETKKPDPSVFAAAAAAPAPISTASTIPRLTLVPPPVPGATYSTPEALGKSTTACPDNQQRYLAQCTGQYKPVCATKINGTKQTVLNACTACADGSTVYFRDSPCTLNEIRSPANLTPCPKNIVPYCRFNINPVCVHYTDGSTVTQSNGCIGCLNRKAYAYRNGECEVTVDGEKSRDLLCGRNPNESLLCLLEYKPVCVKLQDGVRRTYEQACDACKLTTFASYKPGKCGRA